MFGIWTLFYPDYALVGLVKAVTAAASLITAIGMLPLLPKAPSPIPSPAQLHAANAALQAQISEREAAVAALEREQEERAKAEDMLRQAQKMEAVGQLTAGIAHDFNNLLTVVAGGIERARRRAGENAEVQRALDLAQEGAKRAALLTKRLLAFGRQQALAPKVINAQEPIDAAIDTLQRTLDPRIRIVANLAREPWHVEVDAQELHTALLNLGLNSRDAMRNGGNIVVSARNVPSGDLVAERTDLPHAEYFEISVSDNGTGMGPDVAARAFDPFFTTKPVGEGSGLGLSQVYGFARQSGGTAVIESEAGSGTTVRILLPRARLAPEASGGRETPGGAVSPQPV